MEPTKILNGILNNEAHARLIAGEQLLTYLRNEDNDLEHFDQLEDLINGLVNWMSSSNFRVSLQGMDLLIMIIMQLKTKFKHYIPAVVPVIREKLGDSKDSVRDKTQVLIQQIMQDSVSSVQKFLETIMEGLLSHKNSHIKEEGLICISRTLNFFGSGQVSVSKYVGRICEMLGDANGQVRAVAIETLVEIYRHVGVKVRIDLSKREIPVAKLQQILQKFDEIDGKKDSGDDNESQSSCSSNMSSSKPLAANKKKATPMSNGTSSSGGVDEAQFERAFTDVPQINIFTHNDMERIMDGIHQTLSNKDTPWDARVTSLKELRAVVQCESIDPQTFLTLLRNMETPFRDCLKDLRSQVVRESCVTLSCLAVHLKLDMNLFAELMLPYLVALLPNSAKVMASSANVCMRMLVQNCPSHRLVLPIINGFQQKSAITRKGCAELIEYITRLWDTSILDRAGSVLEESIVKGIKDADPTARKHMRRAFWNYHNHYPSVGDRLFNSFDSQLQKHLKDERRQLEGEPLPQPIPLSQVKPKLKKNVMMAEMQQQQSSSSSHDVVINSLPPRAGSLPSIKVRTATVRSSPKQKHSAPEVSLTKTKLNRSSDNLLNDDLGVPARPSSRNAVSTRKLSDGTPPSQRSGRRSPMGRAESPIRNKSSSMSRKLTADSLKQFTSGGNANYTMVDDDDNASVTSEHSTFSLSSEVSISPYATSKYPNPITDLDELVRLCSSKSWTDRRDGMAQLHLLLENNKDLTHSDFVLIKDNIFKRMFSEPNVKVYTMFLDILVRFIEERREYLEDWLFIMLMRLLQKQGSDILKSTHVKIQLVLENIRRSFDMSQQFKMLCRIFNDQSQPMSIKVKFAWLEYIHELVPAMDSEDFKDIPEIRLAFSKLLVLTMEPKSVDIRKSSQRVVTDLFELNTAVFTMLLRDVPRNIRENIEQMLRGYLNDNSSEDEDATPKAVPPSFRSPRAQTIDSRVLQSLTPQHLIHSPDVGGGDTTPRKVASRSGIPRKMDGKGTPSRIPRPSSRQGGGYPPRAHSVDPERMMATSTIQEHHQTPSTDRYRRPASSQSEYMTSSSSLYKTTHSNGIRNPLRPRPPSSQGFMLDHFISTLPMLDYGSPDPDGQPHDQVSSLLKELQNADNSKLRVTALQNIFALARSYNNDNWKDHINDAMAVLIDNTQDDDAHVRTLSLRVIRELMKSRPPGITQFTEQLTAKVLESYKETDCNVSQAAEDLFGPLANAFPPKRVLDILLPLVAKGVDGNSLGALKLASKV
jgi:CLIP-associating protein 1/2